MTHINEKLAIICPQHGNFILGMVDNKLNECGRITWETGKTQRLKPSATE